MAAIHDFESLVLDALDVVKFQLIRKKTDIDDESTIFHPLMAHQIFGDSESIFGYKDLRVRILYTAGPLHIYLGIEYEKKVDNLSNGDIKADDIVGTIAQKLPNGCFFINLDEFLKTLDKADKFHPYGEKLSEYTKKTDDGNERCFEIYCSNYKEASFLKFFGRLQTFILWFVDAASYIDVDDPQWNYFVCYEKYKNENGEIQYATVGYTTVYEYYAYPEHKRPRISQMLVLPPFQRLGIGTKIVESIYKFYQTQKKVIDITVEDPSEEFQRLRNYVDARLCKDLQTFQPNVIKNGFNKEMEDEAREFFKINPRQCRKVYEIVRYLYTNIHDKDDYREYRLAVKRRLNAVYHKQMTDIEKMENAKLDTEWLKARIPNLKQRQEQLKEEFAVIETQYKKIVAKLR